MNNDTAQQPLEETKAPIAETVEEQTLPETEAPDGKATDRAEYNCAPCGGEGLVNGLLCATCNGKGKVA